MREKRYLIHCVWGWDCAVVVSLTESHVKRKVRVKPFGKIVVRV